MLLVYNAASTALGGIGPWQFEKKAYRLHFLRNNFKYKEYNNIVW